VSKANILRNRARARTTPLRSFESAIARIIDSITQEELRAAIRNPRSYVEREEIKKARNKHEEELLAIIRAFGVRQIGGDILEGDQYDRAMRGKPVKIKYIWQWNQELERRVDQHITANVRNDVRESVRALILEGMRDGMSTGEIARRIRSQWHDKGGDKLTFSPERAAIIAQTELAQVENTAIVAGYEMTGIKKIEWLAFSDGRSGDRHHERMNGKIIKLGGYFRLPSGAKLRYPGDPLGPIGETINCRCSTAPVIG